MEAQTQVTLSESVANLKRVLPLMTKHGVPTTPTNYAVWYEYVTGSNPTLVAEMEQLLRSKGEKLSADDSEALYQRHLGDVSDAEISKMRMSLEQMLDATAGQIGEFGGDVAHFSGVLSESDSALRDSHDPESLAELLSNLSRETARTHARSTQVEGSLKAMSEELAELRSEVERLNRDSMTDQLTSIANRRAFDATLAELIAESGKSGAPLCLVMVDIDHFKSFNDSHGHVLGDQVIRFVAQEMQQCTKGRDMVARYGGEEFALLLPKTPLDGAEMLADSIRSLIEAQSIVDEQTGNDVGNVTVSMGVAQFRQYDLSKDLVERADRALYASKERGRNQVTREDQLAAH